MSYNQSRLNQSQSNLNNIELNGGMGSSAYYDARNQVNADRATLDRENTSTSLWGQSPTSAPTTGNKYYLGNASPKGPRYIDPNEMFASTLGKFVFVVSLVVGPFLGYQYLVPNIQDIPQQVAVFTKAEKSLSVKYPNEIKSLTDRTVDVLNRSYSKLFQPATPFEKMIGPCTNSSKTCAELTYAGFVRLQPYAVNQATYWNDVCDISSQLYSGRSNYNGLIPKWKLTTDYVKKDSDYTHICQLTNAMTIKHGIESKLKTTLTVSGAIAGFVILLGFGTMWRSRKKFSEM